MNEEDDDGITLRDDAPAKIAPPKMKEGLWDHVGCPDCGYIRLLPVSIETLPWCVHADNYWTRMVRVDVVVRPDA